jgi:hypothetical protein
MTFLISLAITVLGLAASWGAYKRRGVASGMRGAAWSLVPMAAYMTGLTGFVTGLVFNPFKWAGVIVAGLAALLYVTSGVMLRRRADAGGETKAATGSGFGEVGGSKAVERKPPSAVSGDPDLADIEAILRKRGIS